MGSSSSATGERKAAEKYSFARDTNLNEADRKYSFAASDTNLS